MPAKKWQSLPSLNLVNPLKIDPPKRKFIFHPSVLRGELVVSATVHHPQKTLFGIENASILFGYDGLSDQSTDWERGCVCSGKTSFDPCLFVKESMVSWRHPHFPLVTTGFC